MNRVFALVTISFLWLLPASSAWAGTWSWHSDFVDKIVEVIQKAQQNRAKDRAQDTARERTQDGTVPGKHHPTR